MMTTLWNMATLQFFAVGSPEWGVALALRLILLGMVLFTLYSAQLRRELWSLLVTPATAVVVTLFVAILSILFYVAPVTQGVCSVQPLLNIAMGLQVFFVPLLTMRLVAEERRSGTLELLLSAPISLWEILLAKFAAGLWLQWLMISPLVPFILLLAAFGDIDSGSTLAGLLGLLLLGMVYVAIGLFASILSRSQIAAAMLTMVLLLAFFLIGDDQVFTHSIWHHLSFVAHAEPMLKHGTVTLSGVVYLLSLVGMVLTAGWLALQVASEAQGRISRIARRQLIWSGLLLGGACELSLLGVAWWDVREWTVVSWVDLASWAQKLWRLTPFLLGGACGLVALFVARRDRGGRLQASVHWLGALSISAAIMVIGVNLYVLSCLEDRRYDLSEARLNSLSPITLHTLSRLGGGLTIEVFFTSEDRYDRVPLLSETQRLLKEYRAAASQIQVRYLDPNRHLDDAREAARRYQVDWTQLSDYIVLHHQGRRLLLPWSLMAPQQRNMLGQLERPFMGEQALTSAINRLVDPRVRQICFLEGRGEYRTEDKARSSRRVGLWSADLRIFGYRVTRHMIGSGPIPPDCDLVVLCGPRLPYGQEVLDALSRVLKRGGAIFVLVDPHPGKALAELRSWISQYGIALRNDLVIDPKADRRLPQGTIVVQGVKDHPVTEAGSGLQVRLRHAQSLSIRTAKPASKAWKAEYMLQSRQPVVAIAQDAKGAKKVAAREGQMACAASAVGPAGSRLIVVGDANLSGNLLYGDAHNRTFLLGCVRWLLMREGEHIEIAPREDVERSLPLTAVQRRWLFWVSVVGIPQCFLIIGILIWWWRRN